MDHSRLKHMRVVKYDCKAFANRLWNDMAIYTAGLELGAKVAGPSPLQDMRGVRKLYELWAQLVGRVLHPKESMFAWGGTVRYLPPTTALPEKYARAKTLYLLGMLFRNPVGFIKYEKELKERFGASETCKKRIESDLAPYGGKKRIGVEIRQRPFIYFPDGEFLIPLSRTKEIVDEYLREKNLSKEGVVLIAMSDLPLPKDALAGYRVHMPKGSMKYRFEMLSSCEAVIGTNSSLPNLSAWFANAPHIVTDTDAVDWEYYRNKQTYFPNKYATFTQRISLAR